MLFRSALAGPLFGEPGLPGHPAAHRCHADRADGPRPAFLCKGNQSITYGAGIWHAPMVVIDETIPHLDFAVLIHENGVADEDCQECYFEPGYNIEYTLSTPKL